MAQSQRNQPKLGIIILVIISLVIITSVIIYIFSVMSRNEKIAVEVAFAPSYATIEVGDKKLKNNATNYLKSGKYQVRIYAPDFESIFTEFEVNENARTFCGALNPATQRGYDLMRGELAPEFEAIQALPEPKINFPAFDGPQN